jgi:phage-related minor tail protein
VEALRSKTGATEDAARALGLTFQSAFEDAIIQGDSLSDVLRGLLQDIERIILRLTVTQPLAKGITSLIGGGLSGLFGAGAGGGGVNSFIAGIESTGVFVPLQHGGIITRPTMTVMGEAGPEAVIPLDRLSEFGGGGEITINVDARGAQRGVGPEVERAIISAMNQMRSEVVPIVDEAVKRGGPFRTTFRR